MSFLQNFLRLTKELLLSNFHLFNQFPQKPLTFVIGNDSSDFDSIAGSISLSYLRFLKENGNFETLKAILKPTNEPKNTIQMLNSLFFPIIQCKRQEISERFEFAYFSKKHNIDLSTIIHLEDINLAKMTKELKSTINIILQDHNIPLKELEDYKYQIKEIIDHHDDRTGIHFAGKNFKKNIQKVGSAASLVASYLLKEFFLPSYYEFFEYDLIELLISPILIDTVNFQPELKGNRWVNMDYDNVKSLSELHKNYQGKSIDINAIYSALVDSKFDEELNLKLGLNRLFNKDKKEFVYKNGSVIIPTICISAAKMIANFGISEFEDYILNCQKEKKPSAIMLLHVSIPEKTSQSNTGFLEREMIVQSENMQFFDALQSKFKEKDMKWVEKPFAFSKIKANTKWFKDTTNTYSRKIIEPLLNEILTNKY